MILSAKIIINEDNKIYQSKFTVECDKTIMEVVAAGKDKTKQVYKCECCGHSIPLLIDKNNLLINKFPPCVLDVFTGGFFRKMRRHSIRNYGILNPSKEQLEEYERPFQHLIYKNQ